MGPKSPEMGSDHADVVPAAAQDGVELSTKRGFQGAARETTIRFHVLDHRLDGTSPAQVALQHRGQPALLYSDVDRGGLNAAAAVSAIHERPLRAHVGQDLHLFQGLTQRVSIIGITGHRSNANEKALLVDRRHRHPGPELAAHLRLSLGNAVHLRLVPRVKLALALRLLAKQPVHQRGLRFDPLPRGSVCDATRRTLDVLHHATSIALSPPQSPAHQLELPRKSIALDLARQTRCKSRIALMKGQASILCKHS